MVVNTNETTESIALILVQGIFIPLNKSEQRCVPQDGHLGVCEFNE